MTLDSTAPKQSALAGRVVRANPGTLEQAAAPMRLKETGARVVYEEDPAHLVTEVLRVYRTSHHRRPSCFCAERSATSTGARGETVVDPTCGMRILPADAAESRTRGHAAVFFCSALWARRFDASPSGDATARGLG